MSLELIFCYIFLLRFEQKHVQYGSKKLLEHNCHTLERCKHPEMFLALERLSLEHVLEPVSSLSAQSQRL